MKEWKFTKVWRINGQIVVANTIEEAVKVFKTFMGKDYRDEPYEVIGLGANVGASDYNALIKED